tara:strand:+ start:159140 stop:159919 length:780 start_codon:yes stop_codon:yes gene_type:complete
MIKFFRHIRQRLVAESKFSKYLLYAIGEIILVVIGILIALQINTWSDNKTAVENSKVFLDEMLKDLTSDTFYLDRAIVAIDKDLDAKEWLLHKTAYQLKDLDSIYLSVTNNYWDFYINDRTFQKIQNNSHSKLIGYDSLYVQVSRYYSTIKKRMEKNTEYEIRENSKYNIKDEDYYNMVEFDFPLTRVSNGTQIEREFPVLQGKKERDSIQFANLNIIELRNDTKLAYLRHNFILKGFMMCKEEADKLIDAIEKTLVYD